MSFNSVIFPAAKGTIPPFGKRYNWVTVQADE